MKRLFLTALLLTLCNVSIGQIPALYWADNFGGAGYDWPQDLTIDSENNVLVTGWFQDTIRFSVNNTNDSIISSSYGDIYFGKYDTDGNLKWLKSLGGDYATSNSTGAAICTDEVGNIYLTGWFYGAMDFDPSSNNEIHVSNGSQDIFLAKYNGDGNLLWVETIGGINGDRAYDLKYDSGNLTLIGSFSDVVDFDPSVSVLNLSSVGLEDAFLAQFDINGSFIWAKSFGGAGNDRVESFEINSLGELICTGRFEQTVDFDPNTGTNNVSSVGGKDFFIGNYSNVGDLNWVKTFGGSSDDYCYDIEVNTSDEVLVCGNFYSVTMDMDPNVGIASITNAGGSDAYFAKYDPNGNHLWSYSIGNIDSDIAQNISTDDNGNIFVGFEFQGSVDFDPGITTEIFTSTGNFDGAFIKYNGQGEYISGFTLTGPIEERLSEHLFDNDGNLVITGHHHGGTDVNPSQATTSLSSNGIHDTYVVKYAFSGVLGNVYFDQDSTCVRDSLEIGLGNVELLIEPIGLIVQTNEQGVWYVDSLPIGNYQVIIDTTSFWVTNCPIPQLFTVVNSDTLTQAPDYGIFIENNCFDADVSIYAPTLRRCFSNQIIYVSANNSSISPTVIPNASVVVTLDNHFTVDGASIPYNSLGANTYEFLIGDLYSGDSRNFEISTTISCSAINSSTICMEAELFPQPACVFDSIPSDPIPPTYGNDPNLVMPQPCTLPWDNSSLMVEGWCQGDSVHFSITNTGDIGNGDMDCFSPVFLYVNDTLVSIDSVQIQGQQTVYYSFPANGETWILQAEQHPLHPGNSHPNAHVELCGDDSTQWTPNMVNNQPLDDADPIVDIYCGIVTGSYDPNDKTGFPLGISDQNFIKPNQQLQYVIRFQNTGTDTAFTVVIRDTLDIDLNIFTVKSGVSSHNYTFQMHGPRVLEWRFENIMLPDSTTNETESNGFVTFTVEQVPNLQNGTEINNQADIYFDFNDPITTNETVHRINDMIQSSPLQIQEIILDGEQIITVYPNPNNGLLFVDLEQHNYPVNYVVFDINGRVINSGTLMQQKNAIDLGMINSGIYFIRVEKSNPVKIIKH